MKRLRFLGKVKCSELSNEHLNEKAILLHTGNPLLVVHKHFRQDRCVFFPLKLFN